MEKGKLILSLNMSAILSIAFSVCEQSESFESSEYRIPADQVLEMLNIDDPQHVYSSNKSVVTVRIESGGIVITSAGQGGTSVFVGDSVGLSNSARIDADVDNAGKINIQVHPFDGKRVIPIVKQDVVIPGAVGSDISPAEINLMMDGTHFITAEGMDASSWIKNLPLGLTAEISYVQYGEHPHEVYIVISGIPQSASSEALKITIPAENAGRGWEVYVETRPGAKFEITG